MRRFLDVWGRATAGARSIGVFAGLAVSFITLWSFFFGPEPPTSAIPVQTDPVVTAAPVGSPDVVGSALPPATAPNPAAPADVAQPPVQAIAARLQADLTARLDAENCQTVLDVSAATLTLTPAAETSHGFDGAHLAVTFVVDGGSSRASVTGTGKGPAAANEAYEAALAAASERLVDLLPDCRLTLRP
jgi:hypothetical protein